MISAVVRKSVTDLTRRRARTFFTVLTLAFAVAGVSLFAVSPLMNRAMKREVVATRLSDVSLVMKPLPLSRRELARLAALPNVRSVEPRSVFATRVYAGARRERALVIGVPSFRRPHADVISLEGGRLPAPGAVLTDRNNESHTSFAAGTGGTARMLDGKGRVQGLPISGIGRNLTGGDFVVGGFVTFYAGLRTVEELSGAHGYTSLGLRLDDKRRAAAERTVAAVRSELRAHTRFTAFDDMPVIQDPGAYPGKSEFDKLTGVFTVVTLLALLTALVLVANTMSTLIGEQTSEVAAMKAIGARQRDIRRIYLRTTLLFGALGSVAGAALGLVFANALVRYFAQLGFGITPQFAISMPVLVGAMAVGLVGPPLAALPAVRRASRLPLNEALQAAGSAVGGQGRLDALLRHLRFLPRSAQIGLRGLGRRKRRSAATVVQVGLAVATLLALLSLGAGVTKTTAAWFDDNHFDVWIQSVASNPLGPQAGRVVRGIDGVARVQPAMLNEARVAGREVEAWGLPEHPMIDSHITAGRWYSAGEAASRAQLAVVGPTLSRKAGIGVGDHMILATANGPVRLRVIGISGNQANNGDVVFAPVTTLQTVLGSPGAANSYLIQTSSKDHGLIDRTTTRIEDALAAHGNQTSTLVNYDARAKQIAANKTITTSITVLGLLIVAISMVGLINAITMAVLERTREIGMLRSIGARGRDVRRIFATEGLALAVGGWLLGIPLGYALARGIVSLAGHAIGIDIAFVFPVAYVAIALAGTVLIALLVMLAPLRRAVRFKPGEALRYA